MVAAGRVVKPVIHSATEPDAQARHPGTEPEGTTPRASCRAFDCHRRCRRTHGPMHDRRHGAPPRRRRCESGHRPWPCLCLLRCGVVGAARQGQAGRFRVRSKASSSATLASACSARASAACRARASRSARPSAASWASAASSVVGRSSPVIGSRNRSSPPSSRSSSPKTSLYHRFASSGSTSLVPPRRRAPVPLYPRLHPPPVRVVNPVLLHPHRLVDTELLLQVPTRRLLRQHLHHQRRQRPLPQLVGEPGVGALYPERHEQVRGHYRGGVPLAVVDAHVAQHTHIRALVVAPAQGLHPVVHLVECGSPCIGSASAKG